jgi:hypothetical protein
MLLRLISDNRALLDPAILAASAEIESPIGEACVDFFRLLSNPDPACDAWRTPLVELMLAFNPNPTAGDRRRAEAQVIGAFARPPQVVLSDLHHDLYGFHHPSTHAEIYNVIFLDGRLHNIFVNICLQSVFKRASLQTSFCELLFAKVMHVATDWLIFVVRP